MYFQCRERGEIDRGQWDALVDASGEAWLWHRADFIEAQSTWPGRRDVSFGVFDSRGVLCAAMPIWCGTTRMARVISRRYMRSAGLACVPSLQQDRRKELYRCVTQHLTELLDREDAEHLGVTLSPLTPFVRPPIAPTINPLLAIGLSDASAHTWVVDLTEPADTIRSRYTGGVRHSLRRAGRSPYVLREASGGRDLETYYRLHHDTFSRSGGEIEPFEYYRIIFERFIPSGLARVVFFERDGRVIAGHNTAIYKDAAHYWTGASVADPDGANHTLLDSQIIAARERGLSLYETGVACINRGDAKERGISEYKRSFGATLAPVHAGRLRADRWKFRLYRAARELSGREA